MLLGLHVGLGGNRAAHLKDLHELRHGRQRDLAGPGIVAGRVTDPLPQRELRDPERLQKIRKRDPLRHPPGRLLTGDREIRLLRHAPAGQPHQEGPEYRPDMPGDLLPQPVILTGPVGRHLLPDRLDRRRDHPVQGCFERGGNPPGGRMGNAQRLH